MQYWLLKTEPDEFSWQKMEEDGVAEWDGVTNHQAQNNMKAMKCGDLVFFYHTGKQKAIVGIVEVHKEFYQATGSKFGLVDVKCSEPLGNRVSLSDIKQNPVLKNMAMLKQPRLSVAPISEEEWKEILRMSESEK